MLVYTKDVLGCSRLYMASGELNMKYVELSKFFIITGLFFLGIGALLYLGKDFDFGRLPGDIQIEKEGFKFFFPVTTCLIISAILSLIVNFFFRK